MAIFNSKLLDYVSVLEGIYIVDPLLILVGGLEYIYLFMTFPSYWEFHRLKKALPERLKTGRSVQFPGMAWPVALMELEGRE